MRGTIQLVVSAVMAAGMLLSCSSKGSDPIPDQRPQNVSAAAGPGAGQITVRWDPSPGRPQSYTVSGRPVKTGLVTSSTVTNALSPCIFTVRSPDIAYIHELSITAVYTNGAWISEAVRATPVQRTTLPSLVPQNFMALPGADPGQIVVSWDPVAGGPRYELYARAVTWPAGSLWVMQDASSPFTYTALISDLASTHEFYVKSIAGDSEGITGTVSAVPR